MRDVLTDVEGLGAFAEADRTFQMDEETFRLFYEQTARPVWLYLARITRDDRLADDLLQEAYYRFLRAAPTVEGDEHRRNYLFRIATNLVRDHHRRARVGLAAAAETAAGAARAVHVDGADRAARRIDLARALDRLKPRERSVLWLAYAQGLSHEEIAAAVGVKASSMKAMLHRARRRLAGMLRAAGHEEGRP